MVLLRRYWATLAAALTTSSRAVYGNYEAGTVMSVTPEASAFDTRSTLPSGCPPDGCVAANTRDGDMSDESRWSCSPSLDASGCSITFTLERVEYLGDIRIALYKGDIRTRTIDIYVDGSHITTWTSSGTTTGFESVELMDQGQVVELVGDLDDIEWLSILEVEIDVDDGIDDDDTVVVVDIVEAAEMGTVTATADFYDLRLGDTAGCDPEGCTAALTRDGDMSEGSRWSCAPYLGGPCSISYDLGADHNVEQLRLRMYKGDSRTRTVDVSVDGALVTTWTSSGTTTDWESVDLSGAYGQLVTISGNNQADWEWLSIIETEIMVIDDGDAPTIGQSDDPSYRGCFADLEHDPIFHQTTSDSDLTTEHCGLLCRNRGIFSFYGLQDSIECWCGDHNTEYSANGVGVCDMPCGGDTYDMCGGSNSMDIYSSDPSYIGCFSDPTDSHIVVWQASSDDMTAETCATLCADSAFYGTRDSQECWCGDNAEYDANGFGICDTPCLGNPDEICGGSSAMSVHQTL
ncbi:unnamed protein product [Ectocarpus fasciculatus]